jgi:hypothetical protein
MILNKLSPLRSYALGFRRSRKIYAKLLAAMDDAQKIRMQAVLAELNEMQQEIYALSEDNKTIQAITDAIVERFEHPELRLH